jgi:predicted negative regulator of RcsB-dependent stress response
VSAYSEQEELEKFKAWWKNYGGALIGGALLGLVLLVGNKYWQEYRDERRVDASELYEQLLIQAQQKKTQAALDTGSKLMLEYDGTPYAEVAGLIVARMKYDSGDRIGAMDSLRWVIKYASDNALVNAARLKLARLLEHEGKVDEALSTIEAQGPGGFEAEYLELRGDLLVSKGQHQRARSAYSEAIKALPAGTSYQLILKMKLDDLGPEARQ